MGLNKIPIEPPHPPTIRNVKPQNSELTSKIAAISLAATTVVVVVKLAGAAQSGSISVLGEALQSLLDVLMAGITLWAVRYAAKEPDDGHPYGHGRAELLASAFQMVIAIFTAGVIAWQASLRLLSPREIAPDWGMASMVFALFVNGAMMSYLTKGFAKTGSEMLKSERAHLASDSLASLGVIAGLLLYRMTGQTWIDPAAAILFTVIGALLAFRQLKSVIHPLMDGSLPREEVSAIEAILERHPETRGYHDFRTRTSGSTRHVEMHLLLDDELTFIRAHEVADEIEDELMELLDGAVVTVHYEPYEAEMRKQVTASD